MYEVRVLDPEPATFVAVMVTVYVPGSAYWWTGLWAVDVPPSGLGNVLHDIEAEQLGTG